MHVVHSSCLLALDAAKRRGQKESATKSNWAVAQLDLITTSLGGRAKNSLIFGCILWPLMKYCQRDNAQVREWSTDYEERWGIKIENCISLTRRQPTPVPPIQQTQPQARPASHPRPPDQQVGAGQPLHELRPANRGQSDARGSDIDSPSVPRTGDGLPSLPSLKSSGLLDSWHTMNEPSSAVGQMSWNAILQPPLDAQPVPQTSAPNQPDSESSRPAPSGMPVGMAWLANEPGTPR